MHNHHHHHNSDAPISTDRQTFCPITGDVVDIIEAEKAGHVREHNGKKVYFCCAACVQEFDKLHEEHITHEAR